MMGKYDRDHALALLRAGLPEDYDQRAEEQAARTFSKCYADLIAQHPDWSWLEIAYFADNPDWSYEQVQFAAAEYKLKHTRRGHC